MGWDKGDFLEYRKLKRKGYTDEMLKKHFGEKIYESGMYTKGANMIPYELFSMINEIKIIPENTPYNINKVPSDFIIDKMDYILYFISENTSYTICLMYFKINDTETYNIISTTTEQWNTYKDKLYDIKLKSSYDEDDWQLLNNIISKETKFNNLYPLMKKISFIIFDFYEKYIKGFHLSIGDTENKKKIRLYRNIIDNSFSDIEESEVLYNGEKYFIYKIN